MSDCKDWMHIGCAYLFNVLSDKWVGRLNTIVELCDERPCNKCITALDVTGECIQGLPIKDTIWVKLIVRDLQEKANHLCRGLMIGFPYMGKRESP